MGIFWVAYCVPRGLDLYFFSLPVVSRSSVELRRLLARSVGSGEIRWTDVGEERGV